MTHARIEGRQQYRLASLHCISSSALFFFSSSGSGLCGSLSSQSWALHPGRRLPRYTHTHTWRTRRGYMWWRGWSSTRLLDENNRVLTRSSLTHRGARFTFYFATVESCLNRILVCDTVHRIRIPGAAPVHITQSRPRCY